MHRPRYLFLHRAHAQAVRAQHGDWQVVAVDGRPLAPASATTLRLGGDGFLRGHTGCGDFVGAYAIDADRLSPGRLEVMPDPAAPVAGRPPCAAVPLADQRRFLGVLERVNTFVLRDDGSLLLQAPGEHVIEARR